MTVEIEGLTEVIAAVEIAAWVGSVALMLLAGIALYLLVRTPRRRETRNVEMDELDAEELRALVARMERRLEVLERTMDDDQRLGRTNGAEQAPGKRIN
jgi:Flp pilus assembly protein TadB